MTGDFQRVELEIGIVCDSLANYLHKQNRWAVLEFPFGIETSHFHFRDDTGKTGWFTW